MKFEPIAIVGRACRVPGASDPASLFAIARDNTSAITEVPEGRWRVAMSDVVSAEARPDHAYSTRGGYLADEPLGPHDPVFGLTERVAREALEDAVRVAHRPARVGAVLGNLSFPSAGHARFAEQTWLGERADALGVFATGLERFHSGMPAHRLAQKLGLELGAYALDAACASSLYAVELACRALHDGEADMMLAGAVNRCDDLFIHVGFSALGALSPSGQSRPFHADADGLVPAEGAAFLALQRLDDARREGREIFGVIRGVGLANDGRGRGMLAPASGGQVRSMRAALAHSGLRADDIPYLECHATGTPVGDGTEIESIGEAYASASTGKVIGSVKGNLGHLITAAGAAGLIKVVEAMRAGVMPASPHLNGAPLNPALSRARCEVLAESREWRGPRRAGVSAFGFGGNDAHVIVEDVALSPRSAQVAVPRAFEDAIVVVSLGARVGAGQSAADFASGAGGRRAETVELSLRGLKFPPNDLRDALPQQTMLLAAALEAVAGLDEDALPPERTGVFVGAQCDSDVTRYGARWRARSWARQLGEGSEWALAAQSSLVPALTSAGVIGTMPNIPANRISSQLDLRGPSYTLAAEEQSGVRALQIAIRALRHRELDAALVGAVDVLAGDVVTQAARASLGVGAPLGDAALMMILMRRSDAERLGLRVLAQLGPVDESAPEAGREVFERHGYPHAAAGLLQVADAVATMATDANAPAVSTVVTTAMGVSPIRVGVTRGDAPGPLPSPRLEAPTLSLPAHASPVQLPPSQPHATLSKSPPIAPRAARPAPSPSMNASSGSPQRMPPAPALPPKTGGMPNGAAVSNGVGSNGVGSNGAGAAASATTWVGHSAPDATAGPVASSPAVSAQPTGLGTVAALGLAGHQAQLAAVHTEFIAQQTALHQQFLAMRQHLGFVMQAGAQDAVRGTQTAGAQGAGRAVQTAGAQGAGRGVQTAGVHDAGRGTQTAGTQDAGRGVQDAGRGTQMARTSAGVQDAVRGTRSVGAQDAVRGARSAVSQDAVRGAQAAVAQSAVRVTNGGGASAGESSASVSTPLAGSPTWDREALKVHASGALSTIFGDAFERQDGFEVQVRMPEPPLLLADRVTGIDAEPGALVRDGARLTGTVWTETDVSADSWYLHHGRMPAGVMIESGQADLFLISYLGVDFLNRGERAYRLLGCDLTYHGDLPKIGETLCYDIHVDGHANQGDVRLFFFHYDCHLRGADGSMRPALSVRGGQAGFFTEQELADSAGILWKPETQKLAADPVLDAPLVKCTKTEFSDADLQAFAEGDVAGCFGAGFERARTHNRSPRIAGGRMRFFERVDVCDPEGGPWGRGYLKATQPITPDDWFFDGHFKNDPCMPGTLMFEGCLQAMATYMTSLGHTLDKDGWRFEPVPEEKFALRCRGQVLPSSKELIYEIFVEDVVADPIPTLYADLLCTVDGLGAFHARRMAIRLVPDWPLEEWRHRFDRSVAADGVDPDASCAPALVPHVSGAVDELARTAPPSASAVWAEDPAKREFLFDYESLLACAWGRPSEAFGPMYEVFDSVRRVARLPGPPYHFMSRVTRIDGPLGECKPGAEIEIVYDLTEDVWYIDENAQRVMPFAVLLEAALQPCGWLASFVGSALTVDQDLMFRNLDGKGTVLCEVIPPDATAFRTQVKITNVSATAGMIIESFDVMCFVDREDGSSIPAYELKTVFGFFPKEALENQIGLPTTAEQRALLEDPSDYAVDLVTRPERYCAGALRMPNPMLLMVDRITACEPEGGEKSLGFIRGEKDVDPGEWFFKAHFFQDPVQPGSLGIEAFLQLLQYFAIEQGLDEGMANPRFEAIAVDHEHSWKYRGQVVPSNRVIGSTCEVIELQRDERGVRLVGKCSLWVDGKRIYEAPAIGIRVVDAAIAGGSRSRKKDTRESSESASEGTRADTGRASSETYSLATHPWLADHCPTFTVPSLPMMGVVDRMIAFTGASALRGLRMERWVTVAGETRTKMEREGDEVRLLVWRDARDPALSRFEVAARATIVDALEFDALAPLGATQPVPNPYAEGTLFHGPAFRLLKSLEFGEGGAVARLSAAGTEGGVPYLAVNPALLDAATHAIPHDALHRLDEAIDPSLVAYPHELDIEFARAMPQRGEVVCEVRYERLQDERFPVLRLDLRDDEGLLVQMRLTEVLLPKGPLGSADPTARRAFLEARQHVPGLGLSTFHEDETRLSPSDVRASDWLPGTVASVYGSDATSLAALARDVAALDHVAQQQGVHPSALRAVGGEPARVELRTRPLRAAEVSVEGDDPICVRTQRAMGDDLNLDDVKAFWAERFGLERWPIADLYYALVARFVADVVVDDPEGMAAIRGRSALFLGNHQTGIESLLFGITVGALQRTPVLTLAKDAHRQSWLGKLIALGFEYPGAHDPGVLAFFDREDPASLPRIVRGLAKATDGQKSLLVHVEGTRQTSCTQRVTKMSGIFVDLAREANLPIVPVGFTGGLPEAPVDPRLEFPVGFGKQTYRLGAPVLPEDLAGLPYKERNERVLHAIASLSAQDAPHPGPRVEPSFAPKASPQEVARTLLAALEDPTDETRAALAGEGAGWVARFGAWLRE